MADKKTLLEQALEYDSYGWSIIPIGRDKRPPRGFRWTKYQKVPPERSQIEEWFGRGKYRGLAVLCGPVSGGITVLDFDLMERYQWWKEKCPGLAKTLPTVKTSKGRHIYFRSRLKKTIKFNKMDLKASGYVVLPPSAHPDGCKYEWLVPVDGELPKLNPLEWELEKFTEDTEETEDSEDAQDAERHRSHSSWWGDLDYLDESIKKEVEKAIQSTLPKKQGQRNDAVFPLCQWLKAILELRDQPAGKLKTIVKEWHKRAYPVIGTKPFSKTWADFVHAWPRVKWPKGDVMLNEAVKRALGANTVLPEAEEYDAEEARLLLRVCYELQRGMGPEPFFLASRTAGGILGVSHRTAYKLLEMFVADGILQMVSKGAMTRTGGIAPRYRYIAN